MTETKWETRMALPTHQRVRLSEIRAAKSKCNQNQTTRSAKMHTGEHKQKHRDGMQFFQSF